ncbi:MAG: peptidyl-prolyl cis-trans isomerase [Bacteroidales bacterium]|nr:peptidyl-prolyl cis-trans isomerase [Clostridium sp.]MCM1203369.1 peptidyl-prolyl cis-trans isomerase [Bacteroidales bacterium]
MQRRKKQWLILFMILSMGMLGACGKEETENQPVIVYEFGKSKVTYGEFYIYAKTVEEDYQKTYGNGIWSLELTTNDGKSTVRDVTIRDLILNINRIKVLIEQAEDMNISLSDSEKAEMENAAQNFYRGLTEKDISETEITEALVLQVMEENMIARKVYNQIIAEYDFEISDEEARMTNFYDMVFECYEIKKDGSVEEYTEEKKATQLEKANEALSSLAQEEDVTYDTIVDKYNLEYSAAYTMSRTEMIEEYGESVADKILALSDGEVSTVIQSEYGYHIFKMLEANDEELTKKNKEEIIAQKQKEYFNGVYEEWQKKYDAHFSITEDVDQTLVNRFPFVIGE